MIFNQYNMDFYLTSLLSMSFILCINEKTPKFILQATVFIGFINAFLLTPILQEQILFANILILLLIALEILYLIDILFFFLKEKSKKVDFQINLEKQIKKISKISIKTRENTKLKGDFLARITHELRTPLNGILGSAHLILQTPLTPEQKSYVNTISLLGRKLLFIIGEILDFSKIDSRKITLEEVKFQLSFAMENILELLAPIAQETHVELVLNIDPKAPHGLIGDVGRIQQILTLLIENALRLNTTGGTISLNVEVQKEDDDEKSPTKLLFSVRDTQTVIGKEEFYKMFHAFSQPQHTQKRLNDGIGLGPSIAKKLARMMGGDITVACSPQQGSTFSLSLSFPWEGTVWTMDKTHSPAALTGQQESALAGPLHILVAEDNVVNQKIMEFMLHKLGHTCDVVANGNEVLEALTRTNYDVILMDLEMPEMSGLEAHQRIMQKHPLKRPHVVAVSAHEAAQEWPLCKKAGMDDYLTKPVDLVSLQNALSHVAKKLI